MTGRKEAYGLSAEQIEAAFQGAAVLGSDGAVTLILSAPVTVKGEMSTRGRTLASFEKLVFHPITRIKVAGNDKLISALAATLREPPKVAKRICDAVSDDDFRRMRVLLGHALMVMDHNDSAAECAELLSLLDDASED